MSKYIYQNPYKDQLNKVVFFVSSAILLLFSLFALFFVEQTNSVIASVLSWVSTVFGWYYLLAAFVFFVFVVYIACSHFGNIKLGPSHSEPEFKTFTWAAMLFAAGIGIDLLFFSVAEPITQYVHPPILQGQTQEAAREAVLWTLFHYGISGWCMYALMGMALGFFSYRYNLPLTIRSALYPILGRKIEGWIGHLVDIVAVLGAVFGIATTLGIGIEQLNYGMNLLFGIPQGLIAQIGLIVLTVLISMVSAVSGVNKGIKILSIFNVLLALGLVLFFLVFGNTEFLLNALVMNIGDYIGFLPAKMLDTFAFNPQKTWMNSWTLFFWAWWVAWAPFVGLFLARISRGRTIRQFVFGTLLIPFLFILVWVSVFGNSALNIVMHGNMDLAYKIIESPEEGFYSLLAQYPAFYITASVATFTGLLFYVTSADSCSLVLGNFSSRLSHIYKDSPRWLRVFWSIVIGLVTISMLIANGIPALQSATVIMGLPFSFVMFFIMYGLYRSLKVEDYRMSSQKIPIRPAFNQMQRMTWKQRLDRIASLPDVKFTLEVLENTCLPALKEIESELRNTGKQVELKIKESKKYPDLFDLELTVHFIDEQSFIYGISPKNYPLPPYQEYLANGTDYFKLESILIEGGQDDDLIAYSQDQIINDVVDKYERHLHFLYLNRKAAGDSLIFPNPK